MRSEEPHLNTQSWQAVVIDGDTQEAISIETPFVLLGKHKDCQIQIEKRDISDFAYLVVHTNNKIEAWPLAADGKFLSSAKEKLSISLGSAVVGFTSRNRSGPPLIYDLPKVSIACRGKENQCAMKKSALIIGTRRPSTCRIRGARLATCDIALVYDGSQVWIVDLVAERSSPSPKKRIDLLPLSPNKVNIGQLSISASLPTPDTGPAETLGQTVRRHSTDEIDLAVRLSKLGQKNTLSWRSIGLTGLSLLALFTTIIALYQVVVGIIGER